jgi:TctA family transporter
MVVIAIVVSLMGIIGYFLEANGFPVAPVVLGLVLGPLVEKNFMMSVIKTDWDLSLFFTRIGSAILCIITIFIWFFPLYMALLQKVKRKNGK